MRFYILLLLIVLFGCTSTQCPEGGEPVCGSDGVTYPNDCFAKAKDLEFTPGPCVLCTDSDGGKDIFTAGQTQDDNIRNDECNGSLIKEYYCDGNDAKFMTVPCPAGFECKFSECVEVDCSDSDKGQDEKTKGTVVAGKQSETDSCKDKGTVIEYYCDGAEIESKTISCGDVFECIDGRCVEATCQDPDGKDKSTKATTKLGKLESTDECQNGKVKEYFCSNNEIESQLMDCGSGYRCLEGRCVEEICTDSDNGKDEDVKGTTEYKGTSYTDSCYSDSRVLEYYCASDTEIDSDIISCPSGYECENGRCKESDCREDRNDIEAEDQRYQIESFGSEEVRIYERTAVEIEDDMLLEVYSVSSSSATLRLYEDYDEYLDGDELCSETIDEGDDVTDMCGENTDVITVTEVDSSNDYAELELDGFRVVQYFTDEGYESEWIGGAGCPDDSLVLTKQTSVFYPHIDTSSGNLDLEGSRIRFLDRYAEIVEVDEDVFSIEFQAEDYDLEDGDEFEYDGKVYNVDLLFHDGGLKRIILTLD